MTIKYGAPIKDENMLNELNSNSVQYGAPIKDQERLSQLEKKPDNSFKKLISSYLPDPTKYPSGINIASGLLSLASRNPEEAKIIANLPQTLQSRLPNAMEEFEHSFGKNLPSMVLPSLRGAGFIPGALSRIGGQTAWGTASNPADPLEGAKEFGGVQGAMEALGGAARPIGWIAEKINPIKHAGKLAEKIRNLAQSGYKEGESYYKPVHEKYDKNWVTATPEEYLGFHPEDKQYFKPDVNKAYRSFIAEPSFENLHDLQSEMGRYDILRPMRDKVKDKIKSYLSMDKPMLESYQKGSDILRDKYYPYTDNDVLRDIVEHKKPITSFNPNKLSKAVESSPLVSKSAKLEVPIEHPLNDINEELQRKMQASQLWRYGIPMALGAAGGHMIEPALGSVGGTLAGSVFGHYVEPQLLKIAQNPYFVNALKNAEKTLHGAGRQAVGYNLYNQ